MTKFQEYFKRMLENERESFKAFDELYAKYSTNQEEFQEEFNTKGAEIMKIIKTWENKLCSQSEKAGFGNYTTNLSEKFMAEVRKTYPLIDYVGVIVKKPKAVKEFVFKKINL